MSTHLAGQIAAPLNLAMKDADRGVQRLPEGWWVGWDCDIGGFPGHPVRVPLVVLHPAFGIALLGSEKDVDNAHQVLGRRLAEARFGAIFAGHLPVLAGTIGSPELPRLVPILMDAFGRVQPLNLAGGDAWVATVARLVVPFDRCWTDNLEGLPPAGSPGRIAPAEAQFSASYCGPAAVMPLRRVVAPQPEVAAPEQTLPLPDPNSFERRRWPWALCVVASAIAMVLSLELSYPDEAPAPDAASASLGAAAIPPAPVAARLPVPDSDGAVASIADATRPLAIPVPVEAASAAVVPRPVVLPAASSRTSVAPPRTARVPRPEAARHAQVQAAKAKAMPVVKPVSTSRREAAKRGQANGRLRG
ncbi:hypothetical protein ACFQS7_04170 [Dankookia sp. GCM10030260]|uniref:hypothetical protein n=1 Tax=Dankookia sp. GCM10030260 TaxID=3273390 RepID=UPI003619EA65